jgi:hypothetical protein
MKNKYEVRGNVTAIFINYKGQVLETLVSTSDLPKLQQYTGTWYGRKGKGDNTIYVYGYFNDRKSALSLHRYLLNEPDGMVDHIDHNGLNNTRDNLRVVDRFTNAQNRRGAASNNKSSGIRGITWSKTKKKWLARCQINGKRYQIGYFNELDDAIKALESFKKEAIL